MIKLPTLRHGGIMPNYQCTAACRHCLYACDPDWEGYMTGEKMRETCETLRRGGCRSVHIGGGEPFMDFDGLCKLVEMCGEYGISVEYVETNAFFAADEKKAAGYLRDLSKAGVNTLCISLDPFHAEFVPYVLPLQLAELCHREGFGFFLWRQQFLPILKKADPLKAHNRAALEAVLGKDYLWETTKAYGLRFGGRAITLENEYVPKQPWEDIKRKAANLRPCTNLTSTDHFHVDMYNRFIPPGCTGIALPLDAFINGLPPGKYPGFEAQYTGGPAVLFALAEEKGFKPDAAGYPSVCTACFFVRGYLSGLDGFGEYDRLHYKHSM